MPKGALLHAHFDAMGQPPVLLEMVLKQPAMHIRCAEYLTASNLQSIIPQFSCLPEDMYPDPKEFTSLTDANYQPHTWVSAKLARQMFDSKLGGPERFDRWVLAAMTIDPSEAYGTHNTVKKVTPGL
jgi:adenosine deaminase CECR1